MPSLGVFGGRDRAEAPGLDVGYARASLGYEFVLELQIIDVAAHCLRKERLGISDATFRHLAVDGLLQLVRQSDLNDTHAHLQRQNSRLEARWNPGDWLTGLRPRPKTRPMYKS